MKSYASLVPISASLNLDLVLLTPQIVQTLSAVDRDEPEEGQHFLFSLSEAGQNLSFTLRDNKGKADS